MSIDDICKHLPQRVYIWKLDPEDPALPKVYGTCRNCKTDYHIPTSSLVEMIPDESIIVNEAPFHIALREAWLKYRSSLASADVEEQSATEETDK